MTRTFDQYLVDTHYGTPERAITREEAVSFARKCAEDERFTTSHPRIIRRSAESYANALLVFDDAIREVFLREFTRTALRRRPAGR